MYSRLVLIQPHTIVPTLRTYQANVHRTGPNVWVGIVLFTAILLAGVSCQKEREQPFRLGSEIPLGQLTIRVASVEAVANGANRTLIVYLQTTGVETHEDAGAFMAKFFRRMWLREASGKQYRVTMVEPADLYRTERAYRDRDYDAVLDASERMNLGQYREWGALFNPPSDSRDFTLLVKNPDRMKGQPQMAAVKLGR